MATEIVNIISNAHSVDDAVFKLRGYSHKELTKLLPDVLELLALIHHPFPSVYDIYKKLGVPNVAEKFARVNGKIDHIDDIGKDIKNAKGTQLFTSGWGDVSQGVFQQLQEAIQEYGLENFAQDILLNPMAISLMKTYLRLFHQPLFKSLKEFKKAVDKVLGAKVNYVNGLKAVLSFLRDEAKKNGMDYNKALMELYNKYGKTKKSLEIIRLAKEHHIPELLHEFISDIITDRDVLKQVTEMFEEYGLEVPENLLKSYRKK